MIKIVIIDDEETVISNITKILNLSCINAKIIGTASSVIEGVALLNSVKPDLLLLDIELSDGTGFELLEQLSNHSFKLIFVTAFHEFALKAFKFSAIDYIVKPINPDDLLQAIDKAARMNELENISLQMKVLADNMKKISTEPCKIVLKTTDTIHVVDVCKISHCESDRNYTIFHFTDKSKLMVSKTLKEYETILTENHFVRVHHSHLVNIRNIDKYEKGQGGYIIMKDGSSVPVAVRKKEALLQMFENLLKH
ncbi:MAG: LytTR family DNA-binding domain-containing protein [Bacteroidota bacterium]